MVSHHKAVAAASAAVEALYNRGNILADLLRFEEALASSDKALTIAPNATTVLNNRGLLSGAQTIRGRPASYDKALKIEPDCGAAANDCRLVLKEIV